MKLLLDTHLILWIAENSPKLKERHRKVLLDKENIKYASIASAWEIAIKLGRDDFQLAGGLGGFFQIVKNSCLPLLSIKEEYLYLLPNMPKHHKDPFDRLLIATAKTENMVLVTADENIQKYDVFWFW